LCLGLAAGAVHAEPMPSPASKITPTSTSALVDTVRGHDVAAFAAQTRHSIAPSDTLTAQILTALAAPDPSAPAAGGTLAAGTAKPSATPSAPAGSDAPAVTGDAKPSTSILQLNPLAQLAGIATGMSINTRLALPDDATLSHDTAQAIVRAFKATPGTADQAASDAADDTSTGDPAMDERIALARTVFKVDGTDELLRHLVSTQLMKVIIGEVAKHIDINKLSDGDKYRLSAVAASAQTELEENILNLNARIEATYLTKQDLTLLIVAYDTDAQRKQTRLHLADTGKADRDAMLDLSLSQIQIVKAYESGQ
jgi:hypothetical protein